MSRIHAVGIDLGTTYSCIAYLNEHGEPVTLPNQEGELATPSVVLFDGDEAIVGTEALRNAILKPECVVQNSKRFMGRLDHTWQVGGREFSPVDIASLVLTKLIKDAQQRIGPIERATITVPAQFGEIERSATVEAGKRAGLKHVDIINEPVAAALCYVFGTEGLWFRELADEQQILVYDLGGGTFDLSIVRYRPDEIRVIATGGDLMLGGIDWNGALQQYVCQEFVREHDLDPRSDPQSLQLLANEIETAKRGLSVRPRVALVCQHAGRRLVMQVQQEDFVRITRDLVTRTEEITQRLLKDHGMGWARINVILSVGGSSRMPMIRDSLKRLGGRTPNTSLSPDQSIAHGAAYFSGMLLSNNEFASAILNEAAETRLKRFRQQSVTARALGILVREQDKMQRVPYYLIPANAALPVEKTRTFGTVIPNQERVRLHVVESDPSGPQGFVLLGTCMVDELPGELPAGSEIGVTLRYDEQARVHVSAREVTTGREARAEILREENLQVLETADVTLLPTTGKPPETARTAADRKMAAQATATKAAAQKAPAKGGASRTAEEEKSGDAPGATPIEVLIEELSSAELPKVQRGATAGQAAPAPRPAAVRPDPRAPKGPSGDMLESADFPIPLCNACGVPLDATGRCSQCGRNLARVSEKSPPRRGTKPAPKRRPTAAVPSGDEIIAISELEQTAAKGKPRRPAAPGKQPQKPRTLEQMKQQRRRKQGDQPKS